MISKMKPVEQGGSRLAIVFNGSPLFTGAAGSGESRDPPLDHRERLARGRRRPARPALLQHRHLHLLLGRHQPQDARAPGQGAARRRPRAVREDAQEPRREAQGDQPPSRSPRSPASTATSTEDERVKILPNEAFGFLRITVERPLRLRWEITDDTLAAVRAEHEAAPSSSRGASTTARRRAPRRARRVVDTDDDRARRSSTRPEGRWA